MRPPTLELEGFGSWKQHVNAQHATPLNYSNFGTIENPQFPFDSICDMLQTTLVEVSREDLIVIADTYVQADRDERLAAKDALADACDNTPTDMRLAYLTIRVGGILDASFASKRIQRRADPWAYPAGWATIDMVRAYACRHLSDERTNWNTAAFNTLRFPWDSAAATRTNPDRRPSCAP